MPPKIVMKAATKAHRALLTVSGGKVGWTAGNMPVIELITTGRKSGKARSTMLTTPWTDGAAVAVVASAGGDDNHPAWFLNLRDNPAVTVRSKDETRDMVARIPVGAERTALWETIVGDYDNYASYQQRTDREIPVVVLEPAP